MAKGLLQRAARLLGVRPPEPPPPPPEPPPPPPPPEPDLSTLNPSDQAYHHAEASRFEAAEAAIDKALEEYTDDGLCEALALKMLLLLRKGRHRAAFNIAKYIEVTWPRLIINRAMNWIRGPIQYICTAPELAPLVGRAWPDLRAGMAALADVVDRQPSPWVARVPPGERPVTVLDIRGGLGNQLFQYAAGLQWARRSGSELLLDASWFDTYARDDDGFWMRHLMAPVRLATASDLARVKDAAHVQDLSVLDRVVLEGTGDVLLRGFWPSHVYFESVADEVRDLYRLRNPEIAAYAERYLARLRRPGSDLVALHVRRGDNRQRYNMNRYKLHHPEYYRRAARLFPRGTTFLVFADTKVDIEWCRDNLDIGPGYRLEFSEAHQMLFDFALIQGCDHAILSVSSFSWWATWLGQRPGKVVICPLAEQGTGALSAEIRQDERAPPGWITLGMPPEYVQWWTRPAMGLLETMRPAPGAPA